MNQDEPRTEPTKPESFQNLEIMARTLFAVPKADVEALEKQEKKDKKQAENKPSR